MKQPIFFLMCSERSGSNLISRIFGAHSRLASPAPAHLLHLYGANAHRYGPRNVQDFVEDFTAVLAASVSPLTIGIPEARRILEDHGHDFVGGLLAIYLAETRLNNKEMAFIKENQLYKYAPLILGNCDHPAFVYQVRDPRDMALSWQGAAAIRGGVVRAASVWLRDQTEFLRLWAMLPSSIPKAAVKYETLVEDTEKALEDLCGKLGMGYEPAMLDFHKKDESRRHAASGADWGNISRPVMRGNYNKFRDGLREDQIAYIEGRCGSLMKQLGYEPVLPSIARERLGELETRLTAEEPWEKESYAALPEREKRARREWAQLKERIEARPPVAPWAP